MKLETLLEIDVGQPIGQLRAVPVRLGAGQPRGILIAYCADFDVDPYHEMFFFPTDTLKLMLFTEAGDILWQKDLGRAVVPGLWFCPIFPFDLDGDGVDELWFVDNLDPRHPLGVSHYQLERLAAGNGLTTGAWPWPNLGGAQSMSHQFRNFILGGHVRGEPVLVTAQGTYGGMFLQGWRPGVQPRWETAIPESAPGARGSHMCVLAAFHDPDVQEVLWGERCLELDGGTERFCAHRNSYAGHSDIAQPVFDRAAGEWYLYTCRENDPKASPRVILFDARGQRVWGHVDHGHMDMGWTARAGAGGALLSVAIRIGHKTCGPDGRAHQDCEEFAFDTIAGAPVVLPFSIYQTLPVDLNGDGVHELVRAIPGADGTVLDGAGRVLGSVGGPAAMLSRFVDHPGEQVLTYHPDGLVRVWADRDAEDSEVAQARYAHPLYEANQRLTATGYNLTALAGL